MPPQIIAYLCLIVGLSMVAGWFLAFRSRPYLGLLGLAFLTLFAYIRIWLAVGEAHEAKLAAPGLEWLGLGVLVVTAGLFLAAFWAAVQESRRRIREARERFRAAEAAMLAMLEAERKKKTKQKDTEERGE